MTNFLQGYIWGSPLMRKKVPAEAVSGEWLNFTTFSDDAAVGTVAWAGLPNAESSDNSFASATSLGTAPDITHYLKCLNLAKKIPVGVTITGIQVRIERSCVIVPAHNDNVVSLSKLGIISGDNKANAATWTLVDTYIEYGTIIDMWSLTFTPEQLNDALSGVVLAVNLTADFIAARVDHVQMAVTFS